MELPDGCLSVFSGHLDEDSARFLALTHPYDWPFPGGQFGRYSGWFCKCEQFEFEPSMNPFTGQEILAVFDFAKALKYGWVMFHESGKRHRGLKIYRKLQEGFDPFLYGLFMKRDHEDWRRKTEDWLWTIRQKDDIEF
ncbi:hypothetical protein GR223_05315 [Rhizobium leguminosarum]|uniref:hypothetical protein n=1 Tax=Rhizobium ruizarguesonis TaxID=2081791 RepID=UPI0013DEB838|nr:hypothetical protein [Rhizobium ruizarguesonis]NEJ85371.1 hypothetical protein [Rhizobium ruizarguesonis]